MSDILNKIVAVKHEEVAAAKQRMPQPAMRAARSADCSVTRASGIVSSE